MHFFKKNMFLISLMFLFLFHSFSAAQEDIPGSGMGISASYQKEHFSIQLPIWLNETTTLAPNFGAYYMDNIGTELQIGLLPKFYLSKKTVSPFIGILGGVIISLPDENDSVTDFILGISAGAEYFVTCHFSMSIDAQINASFSDENSFRFSNPGGTNLNTGTGFTATIYF
ncbi:MAG: hypothetical protein JXR46_09285 [Calditrichaceae bacterium]|nr:hypothetical protein [Calditrichaceae bacterium]MBN2709224.1 hypothetical protein [Calditrichaceae bacterium]RQV96177.1 MAG: hypothetical protein EH224_05595 [Calditrichota bacterium]